MNDRISRRAALFGVALAVLVPAAAARDEQPEDQQAAAPVIANDLLDAAEQAEKILAEFKTAVGQKDDKIATFKNGQTPENLMRYDAFRAEMTKGLSGDKLRIMEDVLIEGVVYAQDPPKFFIAYYGEGKKLMTKPEDFAAAKLWATPDNAF